MVGMNVKLARALFAHWMLWTVSQTVTLQVSQAEESPPIRPINVSPQTSMQVA